MSGRETSALLKGTLTAPDIQDEMEVVKKDGYDVSVDMIYRCVITVGNFSS